MVPLVPLRTIEMGLSPEFREHYLPAVNSYWRRDENMERKS
jgi:hypothetical protein